MKNLIKVFVGLFLIAVGFLVGLLGAYAIISIAKMFDLAFIIQFSFIQIYAILMIISIIGYKYEKEESGSFAETATNSVMALATKATVVLFVWGMAFIIHLFIN